MLNLQSSPLSTFCSRACLLLACGATCLPACSSDGKGRPTEETAEINTGTLSLELTARGNSGALYRLRQATFQVEQLSNGGGGGVSPPPPIEPPPFPAPFPGPRPVPPEIIFDDVPVDMSDPGSAGSFSMGGGSSGGGSSSGGSPSTGGVGGSVPVAGAGGFGGGFFAFLFSENDPQSTTLETNLPTGQFLITLFDGWFLERVQGGEVTVVDARLVSPQTLDFFISANEETFVSYRFETNGEIIDFGNGRLIVDIEVDEVQGGGGADPRRGVMENDINALPFSLGEALSVALANAGSGLDGLSAYHGIIDSYATAADGRDPGAIHCDDELTDGQPSLNGFPLQCGRLEAQQFDNIDAWFPLAAVNRLDLAPADGANCGQQRLIFANNSFIGNGRMFVIMESQIPNPNPACGVSACAPIAAFWTALGEIQDPFERGLLLRDAFLNGSPALVEAGFPAFMNASQLGPEGGQIRTNNFNDFIWTLREFQFEDISAAPIPVPVAESPNGALWNDLSGLPQGDACRESFLRGAELGLLTDNLAAMSFPVDQACKDAESRNDGSQDYASQTLSGSGSFTEELANIGAPFGIAADELANRARFAGSCMGCHIEAGGSSLGNGLVAPFQFDFVHVNEFFLEPCGNGGTCFGISEVLRNDFLPHRQRVTQSLLEGPSCGGETPPEVDPPSTPPPPPMTPPGGVRPPAGGPTPPSGGVDGMTQPGTPAEPPSEEVRYTIGGQLVDEHAH